jgi:hypothetical protein
MDETLMFSVQERPSKKYGSHAIKVNWMSQNCGVGRPAVADRSPSISFMEIVDSCRDNLAAVR